MKIQVASQSMSSKCINNSKLNSNAFRRSMKIFMNANKNAHDAMLNMIIIFGSLHKVHLVDHWLDSGGSCDKK